MDSAVLLLMFAISTQVIAYPVGVEVNIYKFPSVPELGNTIEIIGEFTHNNSLEIEFHTKVNSILRINVKKGIMENPEDSISIWTKRIVPEVNPNRASEWFTDRKPVYRFLFNVTGMYESFYTMAIDAGVPGSINQNMADVLFDAKDISALDAISVSGIVHQLIFSFDNKTSRNHSFDVANSNERNHQYRNLT